MLQHWALGLSANLKETTFSMPQMGSGGGCWVAGRLGGAPPAAPCVAGGGLGVPPTAAPWVAAAGCGLGVLPAAPCVP